MLNWLLVNDEWETEMANDLIDEAASQANAELGQDRVLAGETPESYINEMSNYDFLCFLDTVLKSMKVIA